MKKNIMGCISIILYGLFPCLLIYFNNAGESKLTDVAVIMFVYFLFAFFIALLFWWIFRKIAKAVTMANVVMILVCNYELFVGVAGEYKYRYQLMTMIILAIVVGSGVLIWHLKEDLLININDLFCIALAILILFNGIPAVPAIIGKMTATVQKHLDLDVEGISKANPKTAPNIYFLIFDEYGGTQNLKYFFDYDNAELRSTLESADFNFSDTSYNESTSTWTVIPNLLNLDYVVEDDMLGDEKLNYMKTPDLYLIMERLGYEINTCSHVNFLDNRMSKRSFKSNAYFEDMAGYYVLERSFFIHLYDKIAERSNKISYGEELINSMDYFMKLSDVAIEEEKPQFCMGYFKTPHLPYAFYEDSKPVEEEKTKEWTPENYLSYLKWTNGKMQEMLSYIVENDPGAIIIVQSDHGARYMMNIVNGEGIAPEWDIYQYNILNCIYYKGEEFEIEGESGINTVRKVLNHEFDLNLKMVEPVTDLPKVS